jgi:integrase/recombinase XerD
MAFEIPLKRYLTWQRLERGLSTNSLQAYSHDLKRYFDFLANIRNITSLDGISMHHIENFLEELSALGLSSTSIARSLSSIRGFHNYAIAEGMADFNPAEALDLPRKALHLPEVLTVDQIVKMISVHDTTTAVGLRSVAILELLYATGMRVSELCALTLDRLLFDIGYIRVVGKGNKERIIPVGEFAINAVNEWLKIGRPDMIKTLEQTRRAVFLNQRGTPLSRMSVWSLVNQSAVDADINVSVHPHIFRHSCATHMLEGGADLRTVQEMLGHASILTTEIYTHVDRSLLQQTHKMYHPRG